MLTEGLEGIEDHNFRLHLACVEKLGFDAVGVGITPPTHMRSKELGGNIEKDAWGTLWKYAEDNRIRWYYGPTIKTEEELLSWEAPDILAEPETLPDRLDRARRRVDESHERGLAALGAVPGVTSTLFLPRGFERLTVDMYRRPRTVTRMLESTKRYNLDLAKLLIEIGIDALTIGGDLAGSNGPLWSPSLARRFFMPALKEIVGSVKKRGIPVIKHTDGNTMLILEDLINTGIDGYDSIEPRAGMDIGEVKGLYGDKICLIGNVDCKNTLRDTPIDVVVEETHACIRAASPGGGHILGSDNGLYVGASVENAFAMVRTAVKYGRYPIGS